MAQPQRPTTDSRAAPTARASAWSATRSWAPPTPRAGAPRAASSTCRCGPVMAAVCGRDADAVRAAADRHGWAAAETDWRALIARDDVHLVDICTPGDSHAEIAIAALEAGKHVLCEKPLANSVAEAEAMAGGRRGGRGTRSVGDGRLQLPPGARHSRYARRMIAEGRLGTLRHVRVTLPPGLAGRPGVPADLAAAPGARRLRRARRPGRAHRRPRAVPGGRAAGRGLRADRDLRTGAAAARRRRAAAWRAAAAAAPGRSPSTTPPCSPAGSPPARWPPSRPPGSPPAARTPCASSSTASAARSPSTWSGSTSCHFHDHTEPATHGRLPPHPRHRARPPLPGGLVAAGPRPRLRAHLRPPGPRPGARDRRAAPTPNRPSPTASRCSGCSRRSRRAREKNCRLHPDRRPVRPTPEEARDMPTPRSPSSPASGPTCRWRRSAGSPATSATTASNSPAGATTSRSTRRSPTRPTWTGRHAAARQVRPEVLGDLQPPGRPGRLRRPIDERHQAHPARPDLGRRRAGGRTAAGRGRDQGHRAGRGRLRRRHRHRLHRLRRSGTWSPCSRRCRRSDDRARLRGLRRALEPDPGRLRRGGRALRPRGAPQRDRLRLLDHRTARWRRSATGPPSGSTSTPATSSGRTSTRSASSTTSGTGSTTSTARRPASASTAATAASAPICPGATRGAAGTSSRPATATSPGRTSSGCCAPSATTGPISVEWEDAGMDRLAGRPGGADAG